MSEIDTKYYTEDFKKNIIEHMKKAILNYLDAYIRTTPDFTLPRALIHVYEFNSVCFENALSDYYTIIEATGNLETYYLFDLKRRYITLNIECENKLILTLEERRKNEADNESKAGEA